MRYVKITSTHSAVVALDDEILATVKLDDGTYVVRFYDGNEVLERRFLTAYACANAIKDAYGLLEDCDVSAGN